jgi:hypothetical protein
MQKNGIYLFAAALLSLLIAPLNLLASPLLAVDINDRSTNDAAHQQAGYAYFLMAGTIAASSSLESNTLSSDGSNNYTVSLQAFDDHLDENTGTPAIDDTTGQIDDRARATPTNSGALTTAALYQDLIFAGTSTGPTGGIDMRVSGGQLLPDTKYLISIFDFDSGSTALPQPRTANWLDGNNADALVMATSFNGTTAPTSNDQDKFTGIATTDASGALLLHGRNTTARTSTGGVQLGVIMNGFEINPIPEPATLGLCVLGLFTMLRKRH